MKKDMDKLLSRTIFTYGLMLSVIFVIKLFGFNYFQLDLNNKIINGINNFIINLKLENVWYAVTLYINTYVVFAITCNDNSKKMKIYTLITMPLNMLIQVIKSNINLPFMFVFTDLLYLFILAIIYIKIINKEKILKCNISNYWLFMGITFLYQLLSLITRDITITSTNNFMLYMILDIDYISLNLLSYFLYFIKGGTSLWVEVHGYSSVLLTSLKRLPTRLLESYRKAKPKTRQEVLSDRIYIVLFWLYNFFTVACVLLIATLNDTFIECIFILSSFWINKGAFGKPFHLRKASTCFVVSTLSYYVLNRVTFTIGLTFLIPLALGIALSYLTSLLMTKYEVTRLYKGMPEDDFYYLINKVTDNKLHIEICKKFYVDNYTDVKLGYEFNYSTINIKKIKQNINRKIREL